MARTRQAWDEDEDDGPIWLGAADDPDGAEPDLGPDERDMDLLDGSWEERYYAGRIRSRDWSSIMLALGLLVLLGLLLPAALVWFR